jgi:hypothetical protein
VLGDSFTDADYLKMTWPDRVQRAFNSAKKAIGKHIELYSFSKNGAGLFNWHSIFFNDLVPNYEFDALIIASYGDDFARGFSILHYEDGVGYSGRFNEKPNSSQEFYEDFLPVIEPHFAKVATNEQITDLVEDIEARQTWRWPGIELRSIAFTASQLNVILNSLANRSGRDRLAQMAAISDSQPPFSIEELESNYRDGQMKMLWDILRYCSKNNIPVIMAAVPSREGLISLTSKPAEAVTSHQREIRSISQHFGTLYFDGYVPFTGFSVEAIERNYWLKYDAHWNQAGSDVFAAAVELFIIENFKNSEPIADPSLSHAQD